MPVDTSIGVRSGSAGPAHEFFCGENCGVAAQQTVFTDRGAPHRGGGGAVHRHAERTDQQAEAAERFKQVQAAWAVLSDAELRVAYDEELERQ